MLFSIESHITCDFPGRVRAPIPPLDPHLIYLTLNILCSVNTKGINCLSYKSTISKSLILTNLR